MHIVELIDTYLAEHPNMVRAVDDGGRWTGPQLSARARRLAAGLRGRGVGRGDRVAVMMDNSVDAFVVYEAIWRAGAAITPLMPSMVESEVAHILERAAPAAAIASERRVATLAAARARAGVDLVLVGAGAAPGDVTLAELSAGAEIGAVDRADDDLAALLFTGGTTGRSKGVMLTHHSLTTTGRIAAAVDDAGPGDISLVTLPLSHGFGIVVFLVTFFRPLTFLVHPRFDPEAFTAAVEREGVTLTDMVPAMLQALLDTGHLRSGRLRSLRRVYVGASPCPPDLIEAAEEATGAEVFIGYGLTEAGALVAGDMPSKPRRRGSVGTPYNGVRMRIVDPEGNDVAVGEVGEIIARSEALMTGYWQDEAGTAEAIRDGWLWTGDLGRQDEDGYVYIVGRRKELIIRGGFNVYPVDLENVIRECPGVADVCVLGVPDRALGERVVAAVVGTGVEPDAVLAHCAGRVASHKRPDAVVVVAELPLTPVGKPDRRALAAVVAPAAA